ncbi:MAG: HEAT repeat domain-containing protein [Myxococcales bacterium]|nr:HEAT repeat domain-containing protein [Myxococcales bacterium]
MKPLGLALALALTAPLASTAQAASPQVESQVETLLRAPEDVTTAADWTRIGPEAAEVLREAVANPKRLAIQRSRAAMALSFFKGAENQAALSAVAADAKSPWLVRGAAARSLTTSYQAAALDAVAPLLQDKNKRLREAAVKAVALVPTAQSKSLLEARLGAETNDHVKAEIGRAIKQIEARLAKKEGK